MSKKLTSLEEAKDKILDEGGTERRDNYEKELKGEINVKALVSNRFFIIGARKRKTPNAFTEFADARDNLMQEIYKSLKIPQITKWLSKWI